MAMSSARFHDLYPGNQAIIVGEIVALSLVFWGTLFFARIAMPLEMWPEQGSVVFLHVCVFVLCALLSMLAVGLYNIKNRDSFRETLRRIFVAVALSYFINTLAYIMPFLDPLPGVVRELIYTLGLIALIVLRKLALNVSYESFGRKRIIVLGTGERASIIEKRMRRRADRVSFEIVGFVSMEGDSKENCVVDEPIITLHEGLESFVFNEEIDEIVVSGDERRGTLPVDALFHCKLHGVIITDILDFIERETGQIAVNLIYPSWVIYSNGFQSSNYLRNSLDWLANTAMGIFVFLVTWPLMLLTVFAIWIEEGIGSPILYRQERIGLNGKPFNITKFRSMTTDAEKDGAKWAEKNDPRVTKVGAFIRKYRIDELPQIYNVLKGEMGFVGPRPERPEFVRDLVMRIPYYNQRHNVKPGLTGWAQLKYPYGSSEEDALEKLKFDLYYVKHRSFLLDLLIMARTAEIILFGKGR